jgi:hypothetical protein
VNYHNKVSLAITLANLDYRLGRSVRLDATLERIVGDAEAVKLAHPAYRIDGRFPGEVIELN